MKKQRISNISSIVAKFNIPLKLVLEIIENWEEFSIKKIYLNNSSYKYVITRFPDVSYNEWIEEFAKRGMGMFYYKKRIFRPGELLKHARAHPDELDYIIKCITEQNTKFKILESSQNKIISAFERILSPNVRKLQASELKTKLILLDKEIKLSDLNGYVLNLKEKSGKIGVPLLESMQIVDHHITSSNISGCIVNCIFYPESYLKLVSHTMINQKSGKISQILRQFNIPFEVFSEKIVPLTEMDYQSQIVNVFFCQNFPQKDYFLILEAENFLKIRKKISSYKGFKAQKEHPQLPLNEWVDFFKKKGIVTLIFGDRFFSQRGILEYAKKYQENLDDLIKDLRLQLLLLKIPHEEQLKIITSIEEILLISLQNKLPTLEIPEIFKPLVKLDSKDQEILHSIELPFFCQVDSAMITRGKYAYMCVDCDRKVCSECFEAMKQVRAFKCLYCDGKLIRVITNQIELDIKQIEKMNKERFEEIGMR